MEINRMSSGLLGQAGSLTGREALTRFLGVNVLIAVGYMHLMDISHKVEEGVWYMALLFASLIVVSVVLATALVRADDSRVRFVWVGAAGLAASAMFGYFVSRAIPLPGMSDHQGDWFNSIGVFAGLFEMGLVALAAFALRDRVLRRQVQLRARRRARVAVPALSMLGALGLQPAMALAHGGVEMTEEEMAAAEMGHDPTQHQGMSHDPLVGGSELTIILLLALAFVTWAGFALRARIHAAPRRPRPRVSPQALSPAFAGAAAAAATAPPPRPTRPAERAIRRPPPALVNGDRSRRRAEG
jgi:hypothetical protein